MARTDTIGSVYLFHFMEPVAHASHYLGWARDVELRIDDHLSGRGSPLVAAALANGEIKLVRLWHDVDRNFERKLKNGGSLKRVCPICKPEYNRRAREAMRATRARRQQEKLLAQQTNMEDEQHGKAEPQHADEHRGVHRGHSGCEQGAERPDGHLGAV